MLKEFYFANNINLISGLGLDGNKWPFKELQFNQVCVILQAALDPANQPVLIHCNKGKHRTGSIVGCIRRIQNWSLSAAVNEYIMFAAPKTRLEDQRFIESFDSDEFKNKYNNCPDH